MKKNLLKISIAIGILTLLVLPWLTKPALAQETTNSGYIKYPSGWEVIPEECLDPNTTTTMNVLVNGQSVEKEVKKRCDINSFVQLFVNLAYIMLKLGPPLAMIIILYGGFWFLTARGQQEKVQTGKKIISSVFLGLAIIVFIGWTATFFIIQALTGGFQEGESSALFQSVSNVASREWWTGGAASDLNGQNDQQTYAQCCQFNGIGCTMKTKNECDELNDLYSGILDYNNNSVGPANSDPNVNNCNENTYCQTVTGYVTNEDWKCCIVANNAPTVVNQQCYIPNERGCIDFSYTVPDERDCNTLPDLCPNFSSGF